MESNRYSIENNIYSCMTSESLFRLSESWIWLFLYVSTGTLRGLCLYIDCISEVWVFMNMFFVWKCKLCLPVFVRWTCVVLYICMNNWCIVHMFGWPQGRQVVNLLGSPSLNKVFELNWIELTIIGCYSFMTRTLLFYYQSQFAMLKLLTLYVIKTMVKRVQVAPYSQSIQLVIVGVIASYRYRQKLQVNKSNIRVTWQRFTLYKV